MSNQQRGLNPIALGLVIGLSIGVLTGWHFYQPVQLYFANLHATIPLWGSDGPAVTTNKIYQAIFSAPAVATVWLLACGWAGAVIGRRIKRGV
jgi:hypothetical protein